MVEEYYDSQQSPTTNDDDVCLDFDRAEEDVGYLNTYFNRMEQMVRISSRNPTVFAESMTQNLLRVRIFSFLPFPVRFLSDQAFEGPTRFLQIKILRNFFCEWTEQVCWSFGRSYIPHP